MKDEIKEILEILKKCYDLKDENFDNYISLYQLGLLLDHITNLQKELNAILKNYGNLVKEWKILQEENERLTQGVTLLTNKIIDITKENERLKEIIENLTTMTINGDRTQIKNTAQYKLDIYKSRIDKALDKLYCYGEVFDSKILQQFQKEMEIILKGSDNNGNTN